MVIFENGVNINMGEVSYDKCYVYGCWRCRRGTAYGSSVIHVLPLTIHRAMMKWKEADFRKVGHRAGNPRHASSDTEWWSVHLAVMFHASAFCSHGLMKAPSVFLYNDLTTFSQFLYPWLLILFFFLPWREGKSLRGCHIRKQLVDPGTRHLSFNLFRRCGGKILASSVGLGGTKSLARKNILVFHIGWPCLVDIK
jgi:hypothetical protein